MEITRLNIISDFVSPISRVPQVYASFWKWGALLVALYATFTSLFARIKLYIVRLHSIKHSSSPSLHDHLQQLNNGSEFSYNDDDNDNDDDNNPLSAKKIIDEKFNSIFACSDDDRTPYKADQEDYRVAGLYSNRDNERKFIDSEHRGNDFYAISNLFTAGKSVVKQWDDLGLGLGLGFQDNFTSELSNYDACKDENACTFFDVTHQIPAVANLSPAIIYVTQMSKSSNGVRIGAYDRRMRLENPVLYAEWGPSFGKVVDVRYGGVEKVYVKHGGACTVGDMRNFRSPLKVLNAMLEN